MNTYTYKYIQKQTDADQGVRAHDSAKERHRHGCYGREEPGSGFRFGV